MPCYLLTSATQVTRVIMVYLTCLFVTVHCCCSDAKSLLTFYNPSDCSTPGSPVLYYVLEFAETHVLCFTALDFTFTGFIHNWLSFPLWPNWFILSGAINSCPLLFPSSILDTFWPGGVSSSLVISFCLFILFMEFSWQEYWSGLPFPPPIDHVLSELFIITHLPWVVLHCMAYSLIELCKSFLHDKALIHEGEQCLIVFFLYFPSVYINWYIILSS